MTPRPSRGEKAKAVHFLLTEEEWKAVTEWRDEGTTKPRKWRAWILSLKEKCEREGERIKYFEARAELAERKLREAKTENERLRERIRELEGSI